jgi:endonuclease YncB( thermonuclease family)
MMNRIRLRQASRRWLRSGVMAGCALLVAGRVAAQNVINGDTIELGGATYRLYGIDAPEPPQICADGWRAGREAEQYLGKLIDGKEISCTRILRNRDNEVLAICQADGVDLGAAMVTGGHAFAFIAVSVRYISQEDAAMEAGRGVHAHSCLEPWKWRARLTKNR